MMTVAKSEDLEKETRGFSRRRNEGNESTRVVCLEELVPEE
jgi:hypothetical protein